MFDMTLLISYKGFILITEKINKSIFIFRLQACQQTEMSGKLGCLDILTF